MRRRAFTLWEMLAVLVGLAILAAFLFPVFGTGHPQNRGVSCRANLNQIGLAMRQYIQDYDEKYPLVSSNMGGWADTVQPYLKSRQMFYCPAAERKQEIDPNVPTIDYFYNSRLVGMTYDHPKSKFKLAVPAYTIMLGEGTSGQPTSYNLRAFPADWRTRPDSPATRHQGASNREVGNYLMADGSVQRLKPDAIDDGQRRKAEDRVSFAVR